MNNHYIFLHKSNVWVVGRCTELLSLLQYQSFFSLRISCMWVPSTGTDEVLSPSYYTGNPLVVGCLQVTSTNVQATVVPRWRWRVHKIMNTLIGHARFGSRRFSFFSTDGFRIPYEGNFQSCVYFTCIALFQNKIKSNRKKLPLFFLSLTYMELQSFNRMKLNYPKSVGFPCAVWHTEIVILN